MGVDALIPDAQAIDAVWENSAAVYDPTNDVWISHPGDTVTFTINVHNYDVEDIEDALITLPMPATIEFYDLESEYFGGTTGEGYFNPLEGVNGTAHWTIDHLPAGYPDSVWATFKLHCYITTDCYILASTSPDCLLELVVNGTLSGTSAINRMPFVHPFIQGFQQEGVCKGSAISEDLHVIIDREDYVNRYCNCSDVEGQFSTTCYENREVHFCPTNGEPISFYEISKLYPEGTKFYLQSNRDKEYTYETGFPDEVQHGESIVAVLPSKGECESNLTLVQTISIDTIELPDFVSMPITYCLNEEARPLSESIIIPDTSITNYGAFVVFFKQNPGDDPRHTDITAYDDIIPKTDEPGTTDYWVVQFANAPGMECYNSTPTKIDVLVKSPVTMTSSVSTPTCVGEPVTFTPDIRGGVYDIPDDIRPYFSVTNSVATLLGTAPTGTYEFTYTAPVGTDDQGCPTALTQTITHVVTATSNAGQIMPNNTVTICQGSPVPDFTIEGMTGHVLRWEYQNGNNGAWITIANNTNTINQSDLPTLTTGTYHFRALVKNGNCDSSYTSNATLQIIQSAAPSTPNNGIQFACVGETISLNNPSNSGNYLWYETEYGGTGVSTRPTVTMTQNWENTMSAFWITTAAKAVAPLSKLVHISLPVPLPPLAKFNVTQPALWPLSALQPTRTSPLASPPAPCRTNGIGPQMVALLQHFLVPQVQP